jgi:hypothetical protein
MEPTIQTEARERLARELHWKMEHLEPMDAPDWEMLSDRQRQFYRACIEWVLSDQDLVRSALIGPVCAPTTI